VAADDAHQMAWCCIQEVCIKSGEGSYTKAGIGSRTQSVRLEVQEGVEVRL
jgi:hypothetical protein